MFESEPKVSIYRGFIKYLRANDPFDFSTISYLRLGLSSVYVQVFRQKLCTHLFLACLLPVSIHLTHLNFITDRPLIEACHEKYKLWSSSLRSSVVGWGTMLRAGRSPVQVPDEVDFFNWPNTSSRTMALRSTQPLTEMSTRNLPGGKKRPARRADNLAAICEPNVWKCGSLNLSQRYGPPRPVQG
jgi:hypothetical protein